MPEAPVGPDTKHYFSQGRGLLALWAGILLPPFAWFLDQQLSYLLVPWACVSGRQFILHLVTLTMLLLVVGSGFTAWHSWQRARHGGPDGAGGVEARSRFMAVGGLLSSIMFFLVIVAQGIPSFILNACEP
jgi:hypothetical protein